MSEPLANERHELFAQGIASGLTADAAYEAAGFKANRGNASRLKADENIRARVDSILNAAAERVEIDKARVLAELGKIGFSDIRKMFTASGQLKRIEELDDDAAACLASVEVVTKRVPGGEEAEVEHVAKLKMWDKRAALVDIGKHLGMFTEKHEHTGPNGGAIQIADVSENEAARRIAFLLSKASKSPE